jgi:hypothetical protein
MLVSMGLVTRFREIEEALPEGWASVALRLTTEQTTEIGRAAQVLGPLGVGRVEDGLAVTVRRVSGPAGTEAARRLFGLLDTDRVWCELHVEHVTEDDPAASTAAAGRTTALASWEAALATLPSDWTDALCLLEIDSSALLPRAALLCGPLNPSRAPDGVAFTFRAASRAGYGASPGMVRTCLNRLDAEDIGGRVSVLRLLADTGLVATQGPIWRVDGRSL